MTPAGESSDLPPTGADAAAAESGSAEAADAGLLEGQASDAPPPPNAESGAVPPPPNAGAATPPPGYAPAGYGPGYGYPYPYHSEKKVVAGVLGILLGAWGVHRFYLGDVGGGVLRIVITLLTCGIGGLIGLVEGIIYLTKSDYEFDQEYVIGHKAWF